MKCNICGGEIPAGDSVCKYCGNVIKTPRPMVKPEPTPEPKREVPPRVDVAEDAHVYRQREKKPDTYCMKCGRPLDGVTGKCFVCDRDMVGRHRYINSGEEERIMAQKKKAKKKKNTTRNIFLSIAGLIILFTLTMLMAVGPLAEKLGIGGINSDDEDEVKPMETAQSTRTPKAESTWEPVRDTQTPKPTEKPTPKPTSKPEKTSVPKEEGDPVELRGGEYEYKSNTHLISKGELDNMSREQIKHIYWEMYARHGYTFDDELADYFENNHVWYKPVTSDINLVESRFNDIEKRNKETIYKYQKDKGWR